MNTFSEINSLIRSEEDCCDSCSYATRPYHDTGAIYIDSDSQLCIQSSKHIQDHTTIQMHAYLQCVMCRLRLTSTGAAKRSGVSAIQFNAMREAVRRYGLAAPKTVRPHAHIALDVVQVSAIVIRKTGGVSGK